MELAGQTYPQRADFRLPCSTSKCIISSGSSLGPNMVKCFRGKHVHSITVLTTLLFPFALLT